jgi:hypothetical protein
LLIEGAVRAVLVVMVDVLGEGSFEVSTTEDQHPIKTLTRRTSCDGAYQEADSAQGLDQEGARLGGPPDDGAQQPHVGA